MAGSAASESIMFIGAIIAATALAGVITAIGSTLSQDVRVQGQSASRELGSDIQIINDPGAMPSPLVLYIKNTGSSSLVPQSVQVVVDGVLAESVDLQVMGAGDGGWAPGTVLALTVNDIDPGAGDHRVRVTVGHTTASLAWSA